VGAKMQGLHGLLCVMHSSNKNLFFFLIISLYAIQSNSVHSFESIQFIGGALYESTYDSAVDLAGNIYLTGYTLSTDFSQSETEYSSSTQDQNCFLTKSSFSQPEQSKTIIFGGNGNEVCRQIAIDSAQNIYIIGETQSDDLNVSDFSSLKGDWDGFLYKFDKHLNWLAGMYIGGSNTDFAHGLTILQDNKLVIVGETWSTDLITTSDAYVEDCFSLNICNGKTANVFLKLIDSNNINSTQAIYSTYLGGNRSDKAHAVSAANNRVYIVGETQSADFPLIKQISDIQKGNLDAFVSVFDFSSIPKPQLVFSSFIGGNGSDNAITIKIDQDQNMIIAGNSSSDDFPTTNDAFSQRCADGNQFCASNSGNFSDIFVVKIGPLFTLDYASLFGGSNNEVVNSLIIDDDNNWWLAGLSNSDDLPLTDNAKDNGCNHRVNCQQIEDGFYIKLNSALQNKNSLYFSSYIGGEKTDNLKKLHFFQDKLITVGNTSSASLIESTDNLNTINNNGDLFVTLDDIPTNSFYVKGEKHKLDSSIRPPSASHLNLTILLSLSLIIVLFRRPYKFNLRSLIS